MDETPLGDLIARALDCATTLTERAQRGVEAADELRARTERIGRGLDESVSQTQRALAPLATSLSDLERAVLHERDARAHILDTLTAQVTALDHQTHECLARVDTPFRSLGTAHDDAIDRLEHEVAEIERGWQALIHRMQTEMTTAAETHRVVVEDLEHASLDAAAQIGQLETARNRVVDAWIQRERLMHDALRQLEATLGEIAAHTVALVGSMEERLALRSDEAISVVHRVLAIEAVDSLGALSSSLCDALRELRTLGEPTRAVADRDLAALTQKLKTCLPALEQIVAIHGKALRMEITDATASRSS